LPALPKDASKPIRHTVDALFDHDDLILDGDAHEALLANALGRARHGVLIHSTFVGADGWKTALPIILGAASRGVKVQIFWGQDDDARGSSSSRQACEALRAAIAEAGRGDDIIVHPFTTGSHAKLVIADDGQGAWSATIGSCNWLSTDFKSFEASFRLRDPVIVGEMVRHLANLAIGDDGIWGPAAGELTVLGRRIGSATAGTGRKTGMRVLLAPDHADLLLEARDRSVRRMLVASHRIGIGGRPMTIIPALSAAKEKGVAVSLFYGRPTGRLSGHDVAALALDLKKSGVDIRPVHRPRLHAKAVAWDDNALAVSSLNWLSADPSETALRTELGIFVEMNKLADLFVRRFEQARAVL
jgi:phosphatidylserine/phosphatidylglycerophosphate/cardiolipin synthase-like enzyme